MIYFIQEVGLLRNRVKIGFTDDLKSRLGGIRGDSPSPVKVLLVLSGDRKTEAIYHEYFARYRLHREWFKFGRKLRLFIRANRNLSFVPCEKQEGIKPTAEPEAEGDSILDLKVEPEPNEPGEDEQTIIDAVDHVRNEAGKIVFSRVTSRLGWTATGPNNQRIKTVLDKWNVEPEPEPEPEPNEEELAVIEAFVTIKNSPKFSWRKATKLAYGPGKFGDGPNEKMRGTLDKFGIDYSQ